MRLFLLVFLLLTGVSGLYAQQPATAAPDGPGLTAPNAASTDSILVTIILKHQQDKNLAEIRRILEAQGFWDVFPPDDARVVSWNIAVGLGHVIVLQVPANSIRRLNLAVENGAWGAFNSEIYMTYDYKKVWQEYVELRNDAKDDRN